MRGRISGTFSSLASMGSHLYRSLGVSGASLERGRHQCRHIVVVAVTSGARDLTRANIRAIAAKIYEGQTRVWGRLGWSLRRIEKTVHIHRGTLSLYFEGR